MNESGPKYQIIETHLRRIKLYYQISPFFLAVGWVIERLRSESETNLLELSFSRVFMGPNQQPRCVSGPESGGGLESK